uniref:Protein kinase domain-containing protein n=1 Tax=Steinernema glaseri TaxID=37863 RepID=A0A1I7XXC5_9BILA
MDFDDDDDEDIEELVRKIPLTHSRSAHARLSRQNKISSMDQLPEADEDASSEDEEDSDEEFYVHQCLLPLRKSKSDHSFSASHQASILARKQFQNIYDSFKQYELACSTACERDEEMLMQSPEASLAELNRHLDVIWPCSENDEDEFVRAEQAIAQGLYKTVNPELLELINRLTERRNSDISECWSAPGNFFELDDVNADPDDQPYGEQRVSSCWSAPDISVDYQRDMLEDEELDEEIGDSDYSEQGDVDDDDDEEMERRRKRSLPYFKNRLERSCSADDIGTQRLLTMSMTNSLVEEYSPVDTYSPDPTVRFDIGGRELDYPTVIVRGPSPLPPHLYRDGMERCADLCESFDTSTFPSEIVRCEIESPSSDEEAQGDFPLDSAGGAVDCCQSPSLSSSKSETHLRCMLDAGRPRSPFFDHQHPENADLDVPDEFRSRSESNAQLIITHDNTKTMRQSTSYHCGEEMLLVPNMPRCTSPACRSYSHPLTNNAITSRFFDDDDDSDSDLEYRKCSLETIYIRNGQYGKSNGKYEREQRISDRKQNKYPSIEGIISKTSEI